MRVKNQQYTPVFFKWWTTHFLRNRKNKVRAIFYFSKHIHRQSNVSTSQKQGELCTPWASLAAGGRRHFAVQWATAWSAWRRAWSTSFPPGRIQWCRLLPPAWPPRLVVVAVGSLGTHLSPTSTHTHYELPSAHTLLWSFGWLAFSLITFTLLLSNVTWEFP